MNLIFSNQTLRCESSDLEIGQKDLESDQKTSNCSKLVCVLLLCLFFRLFTCFSNKNYEFVHVVLSYTVS